jgi:predicted Zn-dependent protease
MAAELFRQAMELDPQRAEYKDHYAYALINQGQYTQAIALLEQAIRQDPNYDLSYSHLADARLGLGDRLGAVVALQRFLQVSVNQRDRDIAQQKLNELMAPAPAPPPADTTAPTDTATTPTDPDEPRDTIRIAPPR